MSTVTKINLEKFRNLNKRDFVEHNEGYYEYLNVKYKTIADFYRVEQKDIDALNSVNKIIEKINLQYGTEKFDFSKYISEIEKIINKMSNFKNIKLITNSSKELEVVLKAEIKYDFQLESKHHKINIENKKNKGVMALYSVCWEESERGWGVRPDGYSFHISEMEALKFIKDYQDKQPKDYVPDEYSRPSSDPKLIEVSESLYDYVQQYGSVWLGPNNEKAYKTYDASHLIESAKKKKNKI